MGPWLLVLAAMAITLLLLFVLVDRAFDWLKE